MYSLSLSRCQLSLLNREEGGKIHLTQQIFMLHYYRMATALKDSKQAVRVPARMLEAIFEELRPLRTEVQILFPQEDLEEYAHPARVKRSYVRAIKKYPPMAI